MAGKGHGPNVVRLDPALMKWYKMNANRYKYFRWTKYTATVSFIYIVAVPAAVFAGGWFTEGKWDLRGKRRGDLLVEY
ncbi:uncharacterized protein EI97DRAFT_457914 [Westerdykella ornata]|uniref:NADH dehydrogenase [ubiquinone] 1 beta subcomplex subunit 4 n=1 Tax=Westerdykella ornata TaxID=318751 RepID=A0A6A6JL12_WESOR|nr:uncharacterized protein EI97DRAFT_457914 [Westerdykella ornata]KAF2277207.1 hypothetical protein EI97DRAFT_457914 [Westerdykella ornata]